MDPAEKADAIPSDVSLLWQRALDKYQESTGKDLEEVPRFTRVEDIFKDAELQQGTFNKFRHNGEMVDRLRSSVARNVNFLQSLQFVVDGAALAYPPTIAISSAFFHFLQVTKHVSSDYDKIVDFFDSMKTFLERLSIIQGKLPSIPAYKSHVMRVFSAMLSVCGIATTYIKKGRWKKWARGFIDGGADENLGTAKTAMEKSLAELESASLAVILATTQDLKQNTKDIVMKTERIDISSQRIDTRTERIEVSILAQRDKFHEMSANFEKLLKSQRKEARKMQLYDPGKAADATTRKHVAFNSVKLYFETNIDPAWQARDIEYSFVKGSARWVLEEEAYQTWREGTSNPYLWISGDPGLGKTCVAFSLSKELTESVASEPKTSVAAFYFRDDQVEFMSVSNAMSSIIIQVAGGNSAYCEQASSEIGKLDGVDTDDWTDLWERFFQSKFGNESSYRLFLIIDGLDEIAADDRSKFLELLARIRKESLNIHVLLTSRAGIQSSPSFLQPLEIIATKEKLLADMTLLIEDRLARLQNLYKFRRQTKRKIRFKILEKADSMLYVDHMLRRYNSIGREGAVLKDLETSLPDNLQSVYNILLTEVQQRRTSEHLQIFKQLILWLSFAKRLLTVGEVEGLATLLDQDRSYNVMEEVEGKSSSILRITRSIDEESLDEQSDDGEDFSDDKSVASKMIADDNAASLQFLDRSLRDYFRSADVSETGLQTKPPSAHLTIFETSVNVICGLYKCTDEAVGNQLKDYAIHFWADHFLDLDPLSATEPDVVRVIESLYLILNNHNNAAKELESGPLWVERTSKSPLKTMVPLARGHISNWFQQLHGEDEPFAFAAAALLMVSITDLCRIIATKHITDAKNIKMFAEVFPDIPRDETAYRAMGLILKDHGHHEEGIVACNAALAISTSRVGRFRTLIVLAQMYAELYEDELGDEFDNESDTESHGEKPGKDPNQYNAIAYKTICEALSNKPSVDNPTTEQETLLLIRIALLIRGDCERIMNSLDEAVKSYGEARIICPADILDGLSLNEITTILGEQERFVELMENVEQWTFWERMAWLTAEGEDNRHDTFREAAIKARKEDFLIKTYEEIIVYLDRSKSSAAIRWELASFYQTIKGDFAKAKPLFYQIIDGDSFISPSTGDEDLTILSETQLDLSDIIYEEFRRAETLEKKMGFMDEFKRLQTRRRRAAVDDGNVYETASSIVLANMLRKMGPAHEFQNILEKTFQTCMSSLTDDKGWNDQNSLCLLAKVLASVGGLEKEAQIAFSAQFYIVDPGVEHVWSSDEESEWSTDSEDDSNGSNAASDAGSGSGGSGSGSSASEKRKRKNEDFAPRTDYVCNGECEDDSIESWDAGSVYLCMICSNSDLCEGCYQKRQAFNKGLTESNHWRLYCGANHWYIKGPVEGWKGIKEGYMTIGEEKIKFMDWLEEIRASKWTKAWEQFWMREEGKGDILG
ncbi:hypothetical protein EMCG_05645 [[Emmonsia] crescens]|uniref:Uncharacterized protein n=1 Tax=[Emmonsia] crescens TaxID=73230 RepID=A0A0G2JC74_9EURO|nr:hypothetical protein EMCG_05645 [Emmonsia crescens UAMH 3008]